MTPLSSPVYRGRIAPTPTGFLHRGHARTFALAWHRARQAGGALLYRVEDLDRSRCRPAYADAAEADLRWLGLDWDEGPSSGGEHAPYVQSARLSWFTEVWTQLHASGAIYPSPQSRKDVARALSAPHEEDREPLFPPALRPPPGEGSDAREAGDMNWRFRVPDGETIRFHDAFHGPQAFVAGEDFGDFLVWRRDGMPSYELAVVADDHAMRISEVVRGADLLLSTARQLLLYRALAWTPPAWFHVPLVLDDSGRRLAKRHASESLRSLRERGWQPDELRNTELAAVIGSELPKRSRE